ncbi:hypothetical protein [Streptomyces sp. NPDC086838]|uniref:hypothetical protein n=1 Tax=Streptomyces sp. NPDC086838 TaxID=3365762 RepID=UPI0037F712CC
MHALRNVDQRLLVENSRLIAADAPEPTRTAAAARSPALEKPAATCGIGPQMGELKRSASGPASRCHVSPACTSVTAGPVRTILVVTYSVTLIDA